MNKNNCYWNAGLNYPCQMGFNILQSYFENRCAEDNNNCVKKITCID